MYVDFDQYLNGCQPVSGGKLKYTPSDAAMELFVIGFQYLV